MYGSSLVEKQLPVLTRDYDVFTCLWWRLLFEACDEYDPW